LLPLTVGTDALLLLTVGTDALLLLTVGTDALLLLTVGTDVLPLSVGLAEGEPSMLPGTLLVALPLVLLFGRGLPLIVGAIDCAVLLEGARDCATAVVKKSARNAHKLARIRPIVLLVSLTLAEEGTRFVLSRFSVA
jgi:hypothetical protein